MLASFTKLHPRPEPKKPTKSKAIPHSLTKAIAFLAKTTDYSDRLVKKLPEQAIPALSGEGESPLYKNYAIERSHNL